MKKTIWFVVNEGEVIYASEDKDLAEGVAERQSEEDLKDTVDECGRGIDDLTPEELAEMQVKSGYDGGYYYTDSVDIDTNNVDEDEEFETEEGDEIRYGDVLDKLGEYSE